MTTQETGQNRAPYPFRTHAIQIQSAAANKIRRHCYHSLTQIVGKNIEQRGIPVEKKKLKKAERQNHPYQPPENLVGVFHIADMPSEPIE